MKSKKLLYLFLFLLALVICTMIMLRQILIQSKQQERDFSQIQADGVLNLVTEYNLSDYYVSGDSLAGTQYELSQYISNISGLEVNIHLENDLEKCIQGLQESKYDVIARNIPITNETKEILAFTNPITSNKQVLVQRKKSEEKNDSSILIRNHLDLANKTIYVSKGSPNVLRLKNLSEEIAEPIYIKEYDKFSEEQLISMVNFGEIDYAVVDKKIALSYEAIFSELDIETEISFTQFQAWAVRKSSVVLLDSLNIWLTGYDM